MKKYPYNRIPSLKYTALVVAICIIGMLISSKCQAQTRDEIIKAKAEKRMKEKMNDPSSYEFVSFNILTTNTIKDNIESERSRHTDNHFENDMLRNFISEKDWNNIRDFKNQIERKKYLISKLDSIEKSLGAKVNNISHYNYRYKLRQKNEFGAKVLDEYYVQAGPKPKYELKVLSHHSRDLIYNYPFPGSKEFAAIVESTAKKDFAATQVFIDSIQDANRSKKSFSN